MTAKSPHIPRAAPEHVPGTASGATERIDVIARLDDRNRRRATGPDAAAPGRYLEVHGAQGTLLVPLAAEVTHVGRGLACDLQLDDGSVSRRHAIIVQRPSGVRVLDDRSANGTLVNGSRVTQADLLSGDVILLGRVVLRYLELPLPEGSRASAERP
ncbi:MAG TPA: FHA domain-containing protein [Solirubrobacteraceae bacterium]|nr:FHA domain-containing protein [Solirubrobacteraceae bacterium]